MSFRPPRAAYALAAALFAALPVRANDLQSIELQFRAGETEQALRRTDELIAAQPRAAQVRFYKGVILSELKRTAEAKQVFLELTQDYPELADPYNNLAVLYAADGQLQNALVALQAALRNNPAHRAARENLGDVYLALAMQAWAEAQPLTRGDDAELKRKLRLAREIAPSTPARPPG